MKDICIDAEGRQRCWNCGGMSFTEKRTMRSKVVVGVGALMTKKKLKCQLCGEYNDTGTAKPYGGPANRKLATKLGTDEIPGSRRAAPPEVLATLEGGKIIGARQIASAPAVPDAVAATVSMADALSKLVALRDAGALTDSEFAEQKSKLLGSGDTSAHPE